MFFIEALLSRVSKGKRPPSINAAVDVGNPCSLIGYNMRENTPAAKKAEDLLLKQT